jgi:hypothetical protein
MEFWWRNRPNQKLPRGTVFAIHYPMMSRAAYFSSLGSANSADTVARPQGVRSVQKNTQRHDDLSFGDVLEMINPLQHIPLVSNLYQNATGTKISPLAHMIGGAILGGPLGFAVAGINAVFEEGTGRSLLENIISPDTDAKPVDYAARYKQIANAHRPDAHLFA